MLLYSQDIEVGPIRVDTGDDWTDFIMVIMLVVIVAAAYIVVKMFVKK